MTRFVLRVTIPILLIFATLLTTLVTIGKLNEYKIDSDLAATLEEHRQVFWGDMLHIKAGDVVLIWGHPADIKVSGNVAFLEWNREHIQAFPTLAVVRCITRFSWFCELSSAWLGG